MNLKRLIVAGLAVAGGFLAGRLTTPEPTPPPPPSADIVVRAAAPADIDIDNPTAVLLGEVKMPADLLRAPAPVVQPAFIVPDLSR